jgi:hypothetical protein
MFGGTNGAIDAFGLANYDALLRALIRTAIGTDQILVEGYPKLAHGAPLELGPIHAKEAAPFDLAQDARC